MNARAQFDMEGTYAALWHAERAAYMAAPARRKRSADPQLAKRSERMEQARRLYAAGLDRAGVAAATGLAQKTVNEYLRGV